MMSTVWLVEVDVGGYEYMLHAIFDNQAAAEAYAELVTSQAGWQATRREVAVRSEAPDEYVRPVCWG